MAEARGTQPVSLGSTRRGVGEGDTSGQNTSDPPKARHEFGQAGCCVLAASSQVHLNPQRGSDDILTLSHSLNLWAAEDFPGRSTFSPRASETEESPVNEAGNGTERTAAPMPPGPLTEVFSKVSYRHSFRRYQALALDAFE